MNTAKSISIVFVLGQAQMLLIDELLESLRDDQVYVLSTYPIPSCPDAINIKPSGIFSMLAMAVHVWKLLWVLRSYSSVKLYTPHLLNFVANKFYWSLVKRVQLYYLFDGTLNYRRVNGADGWLSKYQKKQLVKSLLFLHCYRKTLGEVISANIPGVKGLYVPSTALIEMLPRTMPLIVLDVNVKNYLPQQRVLVLEPPLDNLSLEVFEKKLLGLITLKYPGYEVLVKLHPVMLKSKLDLSVFRKEHVNINLLDIKRPAELIFQDLECECVISSNSSALVAIKSAFPVASVYSIRCENGVGDGPLSEVESVMRDAGVLLV